jgi:putative Mn2+ efflux pump MntP
VSPWTNAATIIVLGLGANSENAPVGFAYGLRNLQIGLARNLFIAIVTTAATLMPMAVGRDLRGAVSVASPNVIAGLLLVCLGILNAWFDRQTLRRAAEISECAAVERTAISLPETLALACALSVNNIGLGFTEGIAGLGYGPVALSVAGFSLVLLWLGERSSESLRRPMIRGHTQLSVCGNLLFVGVGIGMMCGV